MTPSSRSYVTDAVKVAAHPVRHQILRALKEKPRSAPELEQLTGRSRYDLYHHLGVLEQAGLVRHHLRDGKVKEFEMLQAGRPTTAAFLFSPEEIAAKPAAFARLLDVLEEIEGAKVPHRRRIRSAEILLSYENDHMGSGSPG